MTPNEHSLSPFVPVIPAGGSGTRLWPLSRAKFPKFLVDLTASGSTLLEHTVSRVQAHASALPIVVTGEAHQEAVTELIGDRAEVLAEPTARNSMPAIAWAAAVAHRRDPEAVIGSFAADHVINDEAEFGSVLTKARRAAELGYLVTIGIEPTYPATGFGYIELADRSTNDALAEAGAVPVTRFVEKPDAARAEEFLATGRFVWNAGMFVVKARVLLDALDRLMPEISAGARALAGGAPSADANLGVWESMTAIAIDNALAEPLAAEGAVATVRATFDWDDVGDYSALGQQLRDRSEDGDAINLQRVREAGSDVTVMGGAEVLAHNAEGRVYSQSDRPIALVGVKGVSVVETDGVLLVVSEEHAQDMSPFVKNLLKRGRADLA